MSEMKHTPEPWGLKTGADGKTIVITGHDPEAPGDPWSVADMVPGASYRNIEDPVEHNARRIVACVNACAGIHTEALELVGALETRRLRLEEAEELIRAGQAAFRREGWEEGDSLDETVARFDRYVSARDLESGRAKDFSEDGQ